MKFRIADALALPLDAVTQKIAWLGRTGSGKTFGCKRLVEQMLRADAQVVILDGSGAWAGLRLGKKSFKIPVLGGLYGDIPLEPTGGALVADVIVDRQTSMVLDVSQMIDAERTRFATAFAERFFFRKKSAPSAVHLVLEECQDFVPENQQRGEERMLHEFQRLAKQGRAHGIGMSFISQRPQEISKKALNQAECVFAFQMTGPHERKALQYWLSDKGFDEKLEDVLPRLDVGAPHVWSPQWLKVSKVVHILPIESLDTSRTPKVGEKKFKRRELKPIELKGLEKAMVATIERAKADDPKELKKKIAALEKELLLKARAVSVPTSAPVVKGIVLGPNEIVVDRRNLEDSIEKAKEFGENIVAFEKSIQPLHISANATISRLRRALETGTKSPVKRLAKAPPPEPQFRLDTSKNAKRTREAVHVSMNGASHSNGTNGSSLPKGERSILVAVAQHDGGVTREQLTILCGYKRSTRNLYLQHLAAGGCIEERGDRVTVTTEGIARLGYFEPLPTGQALLEHWLRELPGGESKILSVVAERYPKPIDRDALDELVGFKRSTRNLYLQHLSARHLIVGRGEGVELAQELVS